MPPSAPSQSSPLSVPIQEDPSQKSKAPDVLESAPILGPTTSPSFAAPDLNSSAWWNNNAMMGASPAMNSYGGGFNTMYGGGGMNMPPYMSPMMMSNTMGPFSNITNYLLGLQNLILSIGQVVQIISFNTNSLQHLCESILAMFEHAVRTWHEQMPTLLEKNTDDPQRQAQRQRRLRTLRYAAAVALTYLGYTIVRAIRAAQQRRHAPRLADYPMHPYHAAPSYAPTHSPYHPPPSSYSMPPPTLPNHSPGGPSYSSSWY